MDAPKHGYRRHCKQRAIGRCHHRRRVEEAVKYYLMAVAIMVAGLLVAMVADIHVIYERLDRIERAVLGKEQP